MYCTSMARMAPEVRFNADTMSYMSFEPMDAEDMTYELKTITMTLDDYGAECDDVDSLDARWIDEDLERNETREKEEEEEQSP